MSTATVSLAYRRADVARPLHGFGFVVPRAEERGIMAGTFSSLKFAGRAPDDGVLVRAFVGRAGREAAGRAARRPSWSRWCASELASIVGLRAEPLFTRIFRWPQGMPQYRVGHAALIDADRERTSPSCRASSSPAATCTASASAIASAKAPRPPSRAVAHVEHLAAPPGTSPTAGGAGFAAALKDETPFGRTYGVERTRQGPRPRLVRTVRVDRSIRPKEGL